MRGLGAELVGGGKRAGNGSRLWRAAPPRMSAGLFQLVVLL